MLPDARSIRRKAAERICEVSSGARLVVASAMYPMQPDELLAEVVELAVGSGLQLRLFVADLSARFAFMPGDPPPGVELITIGGSVPARLASAVEYVPTSLWEIQRRFGDGSLSPDAFVGMVAPPSASGYCSMGPMVSYGAAAFAAARYRVLELNSAVLPIPGYRGPAAADADFLLDAGGRPLGELKRSEIGETAREVGRRLANLIPDGATLQLGRGSIPEGFIEALAGKRHLGIHSGAIPEAAIELLEAGVFDSSQKSHEVGRHVATSLLGGRRLYSYAAEPAHQIELQPVAVTHDPGALLRQERFFSINSCFEVDLTGQVNAEFAGGRKASSAGGQVDFGRWTHVSPGGANILALASRTADGRPRIVNHLAAPHVVTTHRSDVDFVVTEYGVADLRGRTSAEREQALTEIAHPDDRAALRRAATGG